MKALSLIAVLAMAALAMWFMLSSSDSVSKDVTTTSESTDNVEPPTLDVGKTEGRQPDESDGDAYTFSGQVVDSQGQPVPDVLIHITKVKTHSEAIAYIIRSTWLRPWREQKPSAKRRSNAEGHFEIPTYEGYGLIRVEALPDPPLVGSARQVYATRAKAHPIVLVVGEGTTLRGRVIDQYGKGVAAEYLASMSMSKAAGSGGGAYRNGYRSAGQTSPSDGRFEIPAVPSGGLSISVHARGRILRHFSVETPSDDEIELKLFDSGGTRILGTVVDEAKNPIEGVRIAAMIRPTEGSYVYAMAQSGADGRYAMDAIPSGMLEQVAFHMDDYIDGVFGPTKHPLPRGKTATVNMTMTRGAMLLGHVRTKLGKPIAGATVTEVEHHRSTVTDDEGAFRIGPFSQGQYVQISIQAPGYYTPKQKSGVIEKLHAADVLVQIPKGKPTAHAEFVMVPGVALTGLVIDNKDRPVGGAEVTAAPTRDAIISSTAMFPTETTRSDSNGQFRLTSLVPGTSVTFSASKGKSTAMPVTGVSISGKTPPSPITLRLIETASIEGKVVDTDGNAVSGIGVHLLKPRKRWQTGPGGSFFFEDLLPGTVQIQAGPSSRQLLGSPTTLSLAPGERRSSIVLEVPAPLTSSGVLLTDAGKPLSNTHCNAKPPGSSSFGDRVLFKTEANGQFEIRHWKSGTYRIHSRGRQTKETFEAGESDLELHLDDPKKSQITIRILDPDGEPIPKCTLTAMTGTQGRKSGSMNTVANGVFLLNTRSLKSHTDLKISGIKDADGNPMNLQSAHIANIDIRQSEIIVRLKAARTIHGIVVSPSGAPIKGVSIGGGGYGGVSDEEGRFSLRGLGKGPVKVRTRPPAPWLRPDPIVVPANQDNVRVVLEEGARFVVSVVDSDGVPVPAVNVSVSNHNWRERWKRQGITSKDGTFEAQGIPKDAIVNVRADTRGTGVELPSQELREIPYGDGTFKIALPPPAWIEGTVVSNDNKPLGDMLVRVDGMVEPHPFGLRLTAKSDPQSGRFRVGPVEEGLCRVSVAGLMDHPLWANPGQVKIPAPTKDVRIILHRAKTVSGTLHLDDITGWRLLYFEGSRQCGIATLGKDGHFQIRGAPELKGTLWATGPKGRYAMLEDILPSSGPFDLRPTQGGTIRGRIVGVESDRVLVRAIQRGLFLNATVKEDNSFLIEGVPPGPWKVTAYRDGATLAQVEDVKADSEPIELTKK